MKLQVASSQPRTDFQCDVMYNYTEDSRDDGHTESFFVDFDLSPDFKCEELRWLLMRLKFCRRVTLTAETTSS